MARTHVVLEDTLLGAIDEVVGPRGRSRFLEQAATEKLQRLRLQATLESSTGVIAREQSPQWADREATAAWVRDIRAEPGH